MTPEHLAALREELAAAEAAFDLECERRFPATREVATLRELAGPPSFWGIARLLNRSHEVRRARTRLAKALWASRRDSPHG